MNKEKKENYIVRFHNHQLGHSDIIHHGFEDTSGLPPLFNPLYS